MADAEIKSALGWAVVELGEIVASTVSPTTRGAMVNWLVTRAGIWIDRDWTDQRIKSQFEAFEADERVKLQFVEIRPRLIE